MRWSVPLLLLALLATGEAPLAGVSAGCPYVIDPLNGHSIGCRSTACPGASSDPTMLAECLLPPPPEPGEAPVHYALRLVAYYVCMDLNDSPPDVAVSSECGPSAVQIAL